MGHNHRTYFKLLFPVGVFNYFPEGKFGRFSSSSENLDLSDGIFITGGISMVRRVKPFESPFMHYGSRNRSIFRKEELRLLVIIMK